MTAAKDEWWPEIETKEALLQTVTLETIVVAADFLMEDAFTCFAYGHGGEDFDDNGIGVCNIDEKIVEIGDKDMVF